MQGNSACRPQPEDLTLDGRLKVLYGELYAYLFSNQILVDLYGDYQPNRRDKSVTNMKGFLAYIIPRISFYCVFR